MTISQSTIKKFMPIIYVPKQNKKKYFRNDVLCEIFPIFAVLWYHWPEDDKTGKPDYEPVILVFNNDSLVAIGIRPHESYKYTTKWMTEGSRPIIVFQSPWHAPMMSKHSILDGLTSTFASRIFSDRITHYNIVLHKRPPQWYVKNGTDKDVYDYAQCIANKIL
jgi:hypothetical protein